LSLSAGYGYLKSPEALSPDESMHRFTAAALHGAKIGEDGQWASAFIYGSNKHHGERSQSVGLETEAILDRWNTILGRVEFVQKSAEDLSLDEPPFGLAPESRFSIATVSLGYIRELGRGWGTTLGLGAMGTVNSVPALLEGAYGSRTPLGAVVFLRIRPFHAARGMMAGMQHDHRP
jgi:hypothetical protein